MAAILNLPKLPRADFPLRFHRNGSRYKSVWNPRTKKSEQFYFGSWADDPKGERALNDPVTGWLARRDAIRAGIDNVRVEAVAGDLSLGELMARFLAFTRGKVTSGELSLATLDGYLKEVQRFVAFQKPGDDRHDHPDLPLIFRGRVAISRHEIRELHASGTQRLVQQARKRLPMRVGGLGEGGQE